ncbi:DUF1579 domain-containing protein [Ramlibacter sp. XY19]|uniref:DUF1579 domain-containing protein n=1 Tax=Ramlibacter paludis TaxID=2908000 RepID=UPI0023D9B17A|nr:DUF1579 domain-containing protein [Ramlibacter paludis]MCG2593957.1 DUF1579 domain-containing protein [Ramlibacter paludis]
MRLSLLCLALLAAVPALRANELTDAQRAALQPLAIFDGTWRGPAQVLRPEGWTTITQTERVGPMLDGALRVIEGRGYGPDGKMHFNAFAVLSYDPTAKRYHFKSNAEGREGDFPLEVSPDGFAWSIQAGPARIRYVATVKDGMWHEVGERLVEGQPPLRIFEMHLKRLGSTGWPADGAVPRE